MDQWARGSTSRDGHVSHSTTRTPGFRAQPIIARNLSTTCTPRDPCALLPSPRSNCTDSWSILPVNTLPVPVTWQLMHAAGECNGHQQLPGRIEPENWPGLIVNPSRALQLEVQIHLVNEQQCSNTISYRLPNQSQIVALAISLTIWLLDHGSENKCIESCKR